MGNASLISSYMRQFFFVLSLSAQTDQVQVQVHLNRVQILNHQTELGADFGWRFEVQCSWFDVATREQPPSSSSSLPPSLPPVWLAVESRDFMLPDIMLCNPHSPGKWKLELTTWNSALNSLTTLVQAAALPEYLSVIFKGPVSPALMPLTCCAAKGPCCFSSRGSRLTAQQVSGGYSVFLHEIKKKNGYFIWIKWCVSHPASSLSLIELPTHHWWNTCRHTAILWPRN